MISKIIKRLSDLLRPRVFGFISPSVSLSRKLYIELKEEIIRPVDHYVSDFEKAFAKEIGSGECVSFAAGRMAFYSILKALGVGKGDDVLLTGFTCSVMANAVLRTGAKPVYVDIEKDTLGMSPKALGNAITDKTKVIVAQHSFGIPCEIEQISEIAKKHGIFFIEDCAISFMSSYKGKKLGDWGDASIYSIDHTKPLNTLIGGMLYSKNDELIKCVRQIQNASGELSKAHQRSILKRYDLENRLEKRGHRWYILRTYIDALKRKLHLDHGLSPYLLSDSSSEFVASYYPYPAKMPSFLAHIGLISLQQYKVTVPIRKERMSGIVEMLNGKVLFPKAYFDKNSDIVPLRVIAFSKNDKYKEGFDGIWFQQPIVATVEPLEKFCYKDGTCGCSEMISKDILNFPIIIEENKHNQLINKLKRS